MIVDPNLFVSCLPGALIMREIYYRVLSPKKISDTRTNQIILCFLLTMILAITQIMVGTELDFKMISLFTVTGLLIAY